VSEDNNDLDATTPIVASNITATTTEQQQQATVSRQWPHAFSGVASGPHQFSGVVRYESTSTAIPSPNNARIDTSTTSLDGTSGPKTPSEASDDVKEDAVAHLGFTRQSTEANNLALRVARQKQADEKQDVIDEQGAIFATFSQNTTGMETSNTGSTANEPEPSSTTASASVKTGTGSTIIAPAPSSTTASEYVRRSRRRRSCRWDHSFRGYLDDDNDGDKIMNEDDDESQLQVKVI
jgi:hypothetical protein